MINSYFFRTVFNVSFLIRFPVQMSFDYKLHRIESMPPSLYYIPDFINETEEIKLLDDIDKTSSFKWQQLSNRRLQNWGGVPHTKGMIQEPIPAWLQNIVDRVKDTGAFKDANCPQGPNHVLLNEYLPGQGIMAHTDGDLFFPLIATVSLGSHTVLNYYEPLDPSAVTPLEDRLAHKVLLEPRSLLLVKDSLYTHYLHGIDEILEDDLSPGIVNVTRDERRGRSKRISLTIRNVPKTSKFKLKLF